VRGGVWGRKVSEGERGKKFGNKMMSQKAKQPLTRVQGNVGKLGEVTKLVNL